MPSRYDVAVDPTAANNAHAFMLRMVGWNRRVLELGAAGGHMTRALIAQGCQVTAVESDAEAAVDLAGIAEAVVGDLNDPAVFAGLSNEFDVVLAGDVLEHLLAPQEVLIRACGLLAAGGRVVVSLPNVAHADVRLALLQGRFDYTSLGLLDETHVRFFTLKSIKEMAQRAGLAIIELERVRVPPFGTEVAVERSSVSDTVLDAVLSDPEAETYQFVFTAVRDDAEHRTSQLASRVTALEDELHRVRNGIRDAETAAEAAGSDARQTIAKLSDRLEEEQRIREAAESELSALTNTKTYRYAEPVRRWYARLRRLRGLQ